MASKKQTFNKLSTVAFILTEKSFIDCDAEIDSHSIRLINWRRGMLTTSALQFIIKLCNEHHLLYYVSFELKMVVIHV